MVRFVVLIFESNVYLTSNNIDINVPENITNRSLKSKSLNYFLQKPLMRVGHFGLTSREKESCGSHIFEREVIYCIFDCTFT